MMPKPLFLSPELIPMLVNKGSIVVMRPIPPSIRVDENKIYSKLGKVNDDMYLIEAGKFVKIKDGEMWVTKDDSAKFKDLQDFVHSIAISNDDELCRDAPPSPPNKMPLWAARVFLKIDDVSKPIRVQDIDETVIGRLGMVYEGDAKYTIGEHTYLADSWKSAFAAHFNHMHGTWKHNNVSGYFRYAYSDLDAVEVPYWLQNPGIEKEIAVNPYVTLFSLSISGIR